MNRNEATLRQSETDKWQKVRQIWEIIDQLRGEPGCPWDRKQTPESLQTYLLEESHETAAAIRAGQEQEVCEELGDLLFMVLFLVHLYDEKGRFGLDEVCDRICEKMIRRHPHVFGDVSVNSTQEVKDNWEKIKAAEKVSVKNPVDAVPASLPALVRAHRILSRLKGESKAPWDDVAFRSRELLAKSEELSRLLRNGSELKPDFLGEMLLELANLGRLRGLRAEDCLHGRLAHWDEAGSDTSHE